MCRWQLRRSARRAALMMASPPTMALRLVVQTPGNEFAAFSHVSMGAGVAMWRSQRCDGARRMRSQRTTLALYHVGDVRANNSDQGLCGSCRACSVATRVRGAEPRWHVTGVSVLARFSFIYDATCARVAGSRATDGPRSSATWYCAVRCRVTAAAQSDVL
jgi:hypothetical protein